MGILSYLKASKTILALFSIILLSNYPADGLDTFFIRTIADTNTLHYIPKRSSFPSDFLFGAGSSALQIEGGAQEGGRGPGVWDDKVKHANGSIRDGDKFPTMIEHYHRYKEDVQHLKKLGINSYRMSISWSRVMPDGTKKGGINQEGVDFYNNLIDELLANGITPFVTIVHFDYPQALQQNIGGFLNRSIVDYYKDYAELLFETYGDRVKHWTTINEAEVTALFNYMHGFDNNNHEPCETTKVCKEAYAVIHNVILAHATAVQLYREKFQAEQGGEIGLVLSVASYVPYSSKAEDVAAAERLADFNMGWIVEPVIYGEYPKNMRELVGNRLPNFTEEEKEMVKGSADFIGINYYNSRFAKNEPNKSNIKAMSLLDNYDALATIEKFNAEGKTLGNKNKFSGSYVYPKGLYDVLLQFKKKYQDPKIYITENGISSGDIQNPLQDQHRLNYIAEHIKYTKEAIDAGVNVGGYFVWAAFDTFEFGAGYSSRWGLIHVDFNNNLKREPTAAAKWYSTYLRT